MRASVLVGQLCRSISSHSRVAKKVSAIAYRSIAHRAHRRAHTHLLAAFAEVWIEPSLQYYRDRTPEGSTNQRWTPGLRVTCRGWERWALESSLTYELGKSLRVTADPTDPALTITTKESSNRVNYSLGARYSF